MAPRTRENRIDDSTERAGGALCAVIPAAGAGARLGSDVPKAFVAIAGVPLLVRTLRRLRDAVDLDQVIIPAPPGWVRRTRALVAPAAAPPMRLVCCTGGATRTESVARALQRTAPEVEIILVHDAARPFVSVSAVREAVAAAREHGAAVVAVPVTDTIKEADGHRRVRATLDRSALWSIQTPQVFRRDVLLEAYARAGRGVHATDDSALVEALGKPVMIVEGDAGNFKVTTAQDLAVCETLLAGSGRAGESSRKNL